MWHVLAALVTGIMVSPYLLADTSLIIMAAIAVCLALLTVVAGKMFPFRLAGMVFACAAGVLYGGWSQHERYNNWLPEGLASQNVRLIGRVSNLPASKEGRARFHLSGTIENLQGESQPVRRTVSLSWFDAPDIQPNELWQLCARLKPPHGFASPGASDYETVLLRQNIAATGYVRECEDVRNQLITSASGYSLLSLRNQLSLWLGERLPERGGGMVRALLLGDTRGMAPEGWTLFRRTGTVHLLVISGLHISLMALFGWWVVRLLILAGVVSTYRIPLPTLAAGAGIVMALFYGALAGFGLPVQRALIMLGSGVVALNLGFRLPLLTVYLLALCFVLILEPLAVTAYGFWLSFLAVAVLLYVFSYRKGTRKVSRLLWAQWVVALGLAPVLASMHQPVSWLSPLVNLMSVPLIGTVLIPLMFVGLGISIVWEGGGIGLLTLVVKILELWQQGLQWIVETVPAGFSAPVPSVLSMGTAVVGAALLFAPRVLGWQWLGILCFLPWLWPAVKKLDEGEVEVAVLDVGQGLAVVVRTRDHTLVYDTGDRFSPHFTAAESVILPYLQQAGWLQPDRVLVSHSDRDHIGGLDVLKAAFPKAEFEAPDGSSDSYCQAGWQWHWNGVDFVSLGAGQAFENLPVNDRSCVLKVCTQNSCALLAGDITRRREKLLSEEYGSVLKAELLIVPHHGSDTSSSGAFLSVVQPEYGAVSAGFYNRFHHPSGKVMGRYNERKVTLLNTAQTGTQTYLLRRSGAIAVRCYRGEPGVWWRRVLSEGRQLTNCEPVQSMVSRLHRGLW